MRIFRQGKREMISGVLPFMVYSRILDYNSAAPKSDLAGVANATNRPLMKDRVDDFVRYVTGAISRDEPFIVPPLTLNANRGLQVYVPESIRISGYAVLPDETKILITDGQHRFAGLKRAADVHRGTSIGDEIMNIGIPFMMTVEEEMIQSIKILLTQEKPRHSHRQCSRYTTLATLRTGRDEHHRADSAS